MAKTAKQVVKHEIMSSCRLLTTKGGPVAVFGDGLVSDKDIQILTMVLDAVPDNGVRNVVFRYDQLPVLNGQRVKAVCIPDSGSIVFNLEQTLEESYKDQDEDENKVSILGKFHFNLVMDMLHEVHHMWHLTSKGLHISKLSDKDIEQIEDEAEDFASRSIQKMAREVNIEPAHYTQSMFLRTNLMKTIVANLPKKLAAKQVWMVENNVFVHCPETSDAHELNIMSFKKLVGFNFKVDMDSPEWKSQPPAEITTPAPETVKTETVTFHHDVAVPEYTGEVQYATADSGYDYTDEPVPPVTHAVHTTSTGVNPTNNTFPVAGATADQTGATPVTLPQLNLSQDVLKETVFSVLNKMYNHIFTNCGRLLNSDLGFQNPEAVSTMAIPLTDLEKQVIVKMDCLSANGKWCPGMSTNEGLRGFVMKNSKVPAYKIYINFNGQEQVRLILPQNTGKRDGQGQYSKPALMARAGSCIMYVKNDATNRFTFKCVDGNWQSCQ